MSELVPGGPLVKTSVNDDIGSPCVERLPVNTSSQLPAHQGGDDPCPQTSHERIRSHAGTVVYDMNLEPVLLAADLDRDSAVTPVESVLDEGRLSALIGHPVRAARLRIKGSIGDATVAFLRILKKDVRLYPYSVNSTNSFMYELLNLRPDPMVVALDAAKNNMAISMESLPDLHADYIAISSGYGANSSNSQAAAEKRYEELRADPLWHTLPAVREGHVLDVDSLIWNAHGLIAKELAIDDLDRWLGGEIQP